MVNWLHGIVVSPLFQPIASVVGIFLGTILAVGLYLKGQRRRSPRYSVLSTNLITDFARRFSSLDVLYDGRIIPTVTVTKLALWNAGRETIRHEDIASSNQFTIRIRPDCEILDAKVIEKTSPSNLFQIEATEQSIHLDFEYLDQNDGAVIQILHTGTSSEDISLEGTVKGFKGRPQRALPVPRVLTSMLPIGRLRPLWLFGWSFIVFGGMYYFIAVEAWESRNILRLVAPPRPPSLFGEFLFLFAGSVLISMGYRLLRGPIPRSLHAFLDEPRG